MNRLLFPILFTFLLASCKEEAKQNPVVEAVSDTVVQELPPLVRPPVPEMDIPFEELSVDAEKGGILVAKKGFGSGIQIPAGVLVDADRVPVKGKVDVRYREFHDVADIFCAGIPMDYDASGMMRRFETAGMFELRAFQEGKEVFVDSGKTISVRFAGKMAGGDYPFFFLDEEGTRNWHYIGQEGGGPNPEKEKIRKRKKEQVLKIPLGPEFFSFNYMAALDVMMNDNVTLINRNRSDAGTRTKISEYGLTWSNIYNYQSIVFEGRTMLASLLVWENISGKKLPDWAGKADSKLTPVSGNVYELELTEKSGGRTFSCRIEAFMSLKSLFAFPASEWKRKYDQTLARVKEDEKRMSAMAEAYREMEINKFGIYNYDRFLKDENALVVRAEFKFDRDAGILQNQEICYVSGSDRSLVKYPYDKWKQFILLPDPGAKLFALLPGNYIAVYSSKRFAAIDQKKLREQNEPAVVFELHTVRQFNGAEDLRTILQEQ